jgi:hypothetical protein
VQVLGADGQVSTREFATMTEARKFADELSKRADALATVNNASYAGGMF